MANPSLQIGNSNWAIKEDDLLGYSTVGTNYLPKPMTMTRASAGTRVNPQGLVETVELLGSELITCGDFSCATPSTYWTEVGNSSLVVGDYQGRTSVANINISGTANSDRIIQDFDYVSGVTYFISVDVYLVSGNFRVDTSNSFVPYDFINTSTTGSWQTLTANFTATSTGTYQIWLRSSQQIAQFYVSNVSVKEVTKNNLARVDYDGTASSLLVEPLRTNLVTYSEDFSQSSWLRQNLTVELNSSVSPSGNSNASKLVEDSSNTTHRILTNAGLTISGDVSISVFAKKGERNWIKLSNNNLVGAFFDLENGVIGSVGSGIVAKIENYGNGWYRCSFTAASVANERIGIYTSIDGINLTYQGDGTSGVYVYGATIEIGSYATSYIPTDGGTVTRVQETYEKTGISNLINSEEGVLFAEIAALSDDGTFRSISLSNGTATNRVSIRYNTTSNAISAYLYQGSTPILAYNNVVADVKDFHKVAIKYKSGDVAFWVDGVEVATSTSTFTFLPLTDLSFFRGDSVRFFYGKVKQLQVFKTALTDTELATLTQ
tara:strand:+ start:136 stop:1779 length:1644 start_codon:yes stop_codon:yes gene_type:complete